jgi:hypothetical protein
MVQSSYDSWDGVYRMAEISECGRYRWWLSRSWFSGEGVVCFVMLNPSTADGTKDDPTIRRCIGFAHDWGYRRLSVRNLYCFRAADPVELFKAADPCGLLADGELIAAGTADLTVAAWGAKAGQQRVTDALRLIRGELYCLGRTKHGQPRHPLYVRKACKPEMFRAGDD